MNNIKFLTDFILSDIILFCVNPSKFWWIFSYLQSYGYCIIISYVLCLESLAHWKKVRDTPI